MFIKALYVYMVKYHKKTKQNIIPYKYHLRM